jgi:hypothetical protein
MRSGIVITLLLLTAASVVAIQPPNQVGDKKQVALEKGYHHPLYTDDIASLQEGVNILAVNQSNLELRDGDLIFSTTGINTITSTSPLRIADTAGPEYIAIDGSQISAPDAVTIRRLGLDNGTSVTGIETSLGSLPNIDDQLPTSGAVQTFVNDQITGAQQDLSASRLGQTIEVSITGGTDATFTDISAISVCENEEVLTADVSCEQLENPDGYLPTDPATSWVNMNGEAIANLPDPTGGNDDWAATKGYVDSNVEANTDDQNLQGFSRNNDQIELELENGGTASFTDQTGTEYTAGDGLVLNSDEFSVNSPTCTSNQYLKWDGASFSCQDLPSYQAGSGITLSDNEFSLSAAGSTCPKDGLNQMKMIGFENDGTIKCEGTTTYYLDEDGDGYHGETQEAFTHPGPDWLTSTQGQDCYDQNADAYPGQTQYFETDRGDGSYDYNCNDTEAKEWPDVASGSCEQQGLSCKWVEGSSSGWSISVVPSCGTEAQHESHTCSPSDEGGDKVFCETNQTTTIRTQGCR